MATLTVSKEEEKRLKGMGFLSNKGTDNFSARVITVNGKVTAAQQRCLAEAAEKFGNGILTFTTRQTVEVQGIPYENIDAFQEYLAKEGLETGGTGPLIRPIVSCKGTTCQYGLLDSFALSEEIHKRFYKGYRAYKLPHKFKIAVGGCPNNCVKPNLNDLGIIGQRIPTYDASLCKGCKKCSVSEACPNGAPKLVDGIMQIGAPRFFWTGALLFLAVCFLLLRRVCNPRVRYISLFQDYFPLWLILGISGTGICMRYFTKTDITQAKAFIMGLVHFHPISAAGLDPIFFTHVCLVSVLLAYFPFSKLTHMAGIFFSPTRNLPANTRRIRHINPWNPPKDFLTYPEYEDMYREAMVGAGLPVDKPLENKNTAKSGE